MPQEQTGPGRSSSSGVGSGMWPHSPPMALMPSISRPCATMPPPTPVPRITPKTTCGAGAAAVDRLGQREAVGVVGDFHRPVEHGGEVAAEVAAVQPGRVAHADPAGGAVDRAGDADADGVDPAAGLGLEPVEEAVDRLEAALVVEARRGHAGAGALVAVGVEHDPLDLGAAVVEPQPHRRLPGFGKYYGEVDACATGVADGWQAFDPSRIFASRIAS